MAYPLPEGTRVRFKQNVYVEGEPVSSEFSGTIISSERVLKTDGYNIHQDETPQGVLVFASATAITEVI